jgi:hypothetical protein
MDKNISKPTTDEEVLRFQINRNITLLFKAELEMLEDIADEHDSAMQKLLNKLPKEFHQYVELADYLNEQKFANLRKRILGRGNDCIRSLEEVLKDFDIKVKR